MKLLRRCLVGLGVFLALLLVLAIAALCALHWYQPKVPLTAFPAPKPVSGAAVFYNQAFAAMPELSNEEKKLLHFKPDQPLDVTKATALVEKLEPSLKLLEQGAKEPECEWGLDLNLGPAIPCPHVAKGWQLLQVICFLRARLNLESGNAPAANDDLLLSLRFGRHLGEPGWCIGNLMRMNADIMAINFATRHLPEFDAASLQRLSCGIASLPPPHSMQAAVALDSKVMAPYLRNLLAKVLAKTNARKMLRWSLCYQDAADTQGGSTDNEIAKIMYISPSLYLLTVHNYEQKSRELEKLMGLPFVEGRPKIDAFEKGLEKKALMDLDLWSRLLLPTLSSKRRNEVQMETAWQIFRTALDAQIHNPSTVRGELAKLHDPYDDSPLDWRDVKGGVEVKLKAPPNQKTLTLMVGLVGK